MKVTNAREKTNLRIKATHIRIKKIQLQANKKRGNELDGLKTNTIRTRIKKICNKNNKTNDRT
jgi:hypothetical protein